METQDTAHDFTSVIPWEDARPDCLVISCSDERFERQTEEFLKARGYKHPHRVQFPSGVAIAHPLISTFGFLAKGFEKLLEKAVEITGASEIICIAHDDCGAYKAGSVRFIDLAAKHLSGSSIREKQIEHLQKSAHRLALAVRGAKVFAFYADVAEVSGNGGPSKRVIFREIPLR